MSNYDLSFLNDKEFERLAIDLLSAHLNQRIERFKAGPDSGVDGRFFATPNIEVIVQCKHWMGSGVSKLLSGLRQKELKKVHALRPAKYILLTSCKLSRKNKASIAEIFNPYIAQESDIYGQEDLIDFLDKFPKILEKYYKLWITSSNILDFRLNSALFGRSKSRLEKIKEATKRYVPLIHHDEALKQLDALGVIIITGEAGIGKTTLADQMFLIFHARGFQCLFINKAIKDAESAWKENEKQIFYFDDFLGRNYLAALERHEGSEIVQFMERVRRDPTKRFILTSRTTILKQGWELTDVFDNAGLERNRFELRINQITDFDKAKILYNHLYFSQLDPDFVDQVVIEKRYLKVITHKHFNPRIIDFVTDIKHLGAIDREAYWSLVITSLDDPKVIWRNVFDNQLNEYGRWILITVVTNGGEISEKALKDAFSSTLHSSGRTCTSEDFNSFDRSLRQAVGAVVNRELLAPKQKIRITLYNPSVGDYLLHHFKENPQAWRDHFINLDTLESLDNLAAFLRTGVLDKAEGEGVYNNLLEKCLSRRGQELADYDFRVFGKCVELELCSDEQLLMISKLMRKSYQYAPRLKCLDDLLELVNRLLEQQFIEDSEPWLNLLFDHLLKARLGSAELELLMELLWKVKLEIAEKYEELCKNKLLDFWQDDDVLREFIAEEGFLGKYQDKEEAEENASTDFETYLCEHLRSTYAVEISEDEVFGNCLQHFDMSGEVDSWFDEGYRVSQDKGKSGREEEERMLEAIHDLFHKS